MMTGWVAVSWSAVDYVGGPGREQQWDPHMSTSPWLKSPIAGWPVPRGREHRATTITAPLSRACPRWGLIVKHPHLPKEKGESKANSSSPEFPLHFLFNLQEGNQVQVWGYVCMRQYHDQVGLMQKDSGQVGHLRLAIINAA